MKLNLNIAARFRPFCIYGKAGDLFLKRWTLFKTPWFRIVLHCFIRSDADEELHDHPWNFLTIILKGGYYEELGTSLKHPTRNKRISFIHWRPPGSILYRPAKTIHRVILSEGTASWSLVFTGKKIRDWGFWTEEHGWCIWHKFINDRCGE
jgi:hypothetical protein